MKRPSSLVLKNLLIRLLKTFNNLPKLHRLILIVSSAFLLVLLIIPVNKKAQEPDYTAVGKRIDIALPSDIVPNSALTNTKQVIQHSAVQVERQQVAKPLPSMNRSRTTQQEGSLSKSRIESGLIPKVKETGSLEKLARLSWQTIKVRSGDSLALILKRLGFTAQTTFAVSTAKGDDSKLLKRLNVGDELRIASDQESQLAALE
jgi:cell envelope opacity-associated protein A